MTMPTSQQAEINVISAKNPSTIDLSYLAHYRELIWALSRKELATRYKQTVLGILWALIKPLSMMIVFAILLGRFEKSQTNLPYGPICLCGLVVWQLMASIVSQTSQSIVGNMSLVTKASFPRMVMPIAASIPAFAEFLISFLVLLALIACYRLPFTLNAVAAPLFALAAAGISFGAGLWLAALNVRYRDINHILPFILQFVMFASPVVYPLSFLSEPYRHLSVYNPLTFLLEGFRWALIGRES